MSEICLLSCDFAIAVASLLPTLVFPCDATQICSFGVDKISNEFKLHFLVLFTAKKIPDRPTDFI